MSYGNSQGNILVLAEIKGSEIDSVTFQLAGKGRALAQKLNCRLDALLIGHQLDSLSKQLLDKGFDTVFVADNPLLERHNPDVYPKVVSDFLKQSVPRLFLLGYTYLGMELGPAVATRLGTGLASNCVNVEIADGRITVTRPMFGGVVHSKLEATKLPLMVSLQKDVLPAIIPDQKPGKLVTVDVKIAANDIRTKVGDLLHEATSGIDITKADILIAVGQGIGKQSGIELIKELADKLHATIACSRPISQWGWLPADCYVGISGKTVHPKLYLACGISGAPQHVAGMRNSNTIIALNSDPNAPIFKVAHYGIAGDLYEVLPVLLNLVKGS